MSDLIYDPKVFDIPDFLGKAARVDSVASLLQQAQEQLQNLHNVMILNGQSLSDKISSEQNSHTYQERFDKLKSGMNDLMVKNKDIYEDLIAEAVKRRKQVEDKLANV